MWLTGRPKGVAFVNAVIHPKVKRSGIDAWGQFLEARFLALVALVCIPPWSEVPRPSTVDTAHTVEPIAELDAWHAAKLMGMGVNIGNTLENTKLWEIGWGNPRITQEYIGSLAALGFKSVRLPVA